MSDVMQQAELTRLYFCGGTGANLGTQLSMEDHPQVAVSYIDTSHANVGDRHTEDNAYYLPDRDGSGMDRASNAREIARAMPDILARFTPCDFNIVVFSLAGGSGSVIGPLIMSNLLKEGHNVVAVTIDATDSNKALNNTIKTVKSLEAIALGVQQPVITAYLSNIDGVPRGDTDDEAMGVINALVTLSNQTHRELDTADLTSWTHFQRVSNIEPQLATLTVFDDRREAQQVLEPISVASLYANPDDAQAFGNPHYATTGYFRPGQHDHDQLHFVINTYDLEEITRLLHDRDAQLTRSYSQHKRRTPLVSRDDTPDDDGLIL